jgi:DNA repair protein RecO
MHSADGVQHLSIRKISKMVRPDHMDQAKFIETPGIIIGSRQLRESDLLLSVITSRLGGIEVLARGGKRSKRRFMGLLDILSCCSFKLNPNRSGSLADSFTVEAANQLENWNSLRSDLKKFQLASLVCELTGIFVHPGDPDGSRYYEIVFRSLRKINSLHTDAELLAISTYFTLKCLDIAGVNLVEDEDYLSTHQELLPYLRAKQTEDAPVITSDLTLPIRATSAALEYIQRLTHRRIFSWDRNTALTFGAPAAGTAAV